MPIYTNARYCCDHIDAETFRGYLSRTMIIVVQQDLTMTSLSSDLLLLWETPLLGKTTLPLFTDCQHIINVVFHQTNSKENYLLDWIIVSITVQPYTSTTQSTTKHTHCEASTQILALSADTGDIIWKQTNPNHNQEEELTLSLPNNAINEDIQQILLKHQSLRSTEWIHFRHSVLNILPHHWHDSQDNQLKLYKFQREHSLENIRPSVDSSSIPSSSSSTSASNDNNKKKARKAKSLLKLTNPGTNNTMYATLQNKKNLPKAHHSLGKLKPSHGSFNNVVILYHEHGISVVALANGQQLLSIAMEKDVTYGDINHDGIIDAIHYTNQPNYHNILHINTDDISPQQPLQRCYLTITSGLPTQSLLFNQTNVCSEDRSDRYMPHTNPSVHHDRYAKGKHHPHPHMKPHKSLEQEVNQDFDEEDNGQEKLLLPKRLDLILPTLSSASPSASSTSTNEDRYLPGFVVASHDGHIMAYSSKKGKLLWESSEGVEWNIDARKPIYNKRPSLLYYQPFHVTHQTEGVEGKVGDKGSQPQIDALFLIGDYTMTLISLFGRTLITTTDIPSKIMSKPMLVDFDNDGIQDIVLNTKAALIGYKVVLTTSMSPFLIPFVFLLSVAIMIFVIKIVFRDAIVDEVRPLNGKKGKKGVSWVHWLDTLHISRSTDRSHFD